MKKILLIEDDEKISLALTIRLKAHGYAIWSAGDAITGLKLAIAHQPDLILLDISLPAGDGLKLAGHLKALRETAGIPVIVATASKDTDLRQKAIELGAVGLLRKPYDAESLLVIVQHALGGPPRHTFTSSTASPSAPSPAAKRARKRILIVEDDQRVAQALELRMKAAGYDTTVATDALAGVRSAVHVQPDLVLLDISLPAGSGFHVARGIQTNIPTPTPIIFLTASKRNEFLQQAHDLGAVAFFEKPYESEALVAAVKHALA